MRVNTFKQFNFTADLSTFTTTTDSEGAPVFNYEFNRNIRLRAISTVAGRLFVFFKDTESDVITLCRLSNFRDASGEEIRPNGVWVLEQVEPQFNLYGHREGFKGVAVYFATTG